MSTVFILLVLGLVLIFVEAILPGAIAGILGVLCLIASITYSYSISIPLGHTILAFSIAAVTLAVYLWVKYFPGSRMGRKFVSETQIGGLGIEKQNLLNRTGTAYTKLRPSGTALIDGKKVDVVTEGALIERNDPIKVIHVEGMRVVVRKQELQSTI